MISAKKISILFFAISIVGVLFVFYYNPDIHQRMIRKYDISLYKLQYGSSCIIYDSSSRCLCIANNSNHSTLAQSEFVFPEQIDSDSRCLMTVSPSGRLGNLMGQYATLYGLSKMNDRPRFILPDMSSALKDYFELSTPVMDYRIATNFPWAVHHLQDWMEPKHAAIKGRFIRLTGYPCSWTFYHEFQDEIRKEFRFRPHIVNEVNSYLSYIRGNRTNVTFIAVHIRRGDYVNLMQTSYKGVLADADYLSTAMFYFRARYKNTLFVVCSDDIAWARKNVDTTKPDVVFGWLGKSYSPGYDLALLSHCNHTIMTIGTYGYWAAYLAGGETIYLSNFTRPDSVWWTFFRFETNMLPEWIGIPAKNLKITTARTTSTTSTPSTSTTHMSSTTDKPSSTTNKPFSTTNKHSSTTDKPSTSSINVLTNTQ